MSQSRRLRTNKTAQGSKKIGPRARPVKLPPTANINPTSTADAEGNKQKAIAGDLDASLARARADLYEMLPAALRPCFKLPTLLPSEDPIEWYLLAYMACLDQQPQN